MYMLKRVFMPRKLLDQWAVQIRNAVVQSAAKLLIEPAKQKYLNWGPIVKKEIGINFPAYV